VQPLQITLERKADVYSVLIANPNADYIEGHITLVTPLESWGEAVNSYALSEITPRLHPFRLEARSQQRFDFTRLGPEDSTWIFAKIAWYGNLQYVQL
jgi:hypothetical protein